MFNRLSVGVFIGWFGFLAEFLLFRESFVMFGGGDVSVGLLYFVWFCFSAVGAYFSSRVLSPGRAKRALDKWIWEFALGFLFSLLVFLWFMSSLNFRLGIRPSVFMLFCMQVVAVAPTAFNIGRLFGIGAMLEDARPLLIWETVSFAVASFLITMLFASGISGAVVIAVGMLVFSVWFLRRRYYVLAVISVVVFSFIFLAGFPYAKGRLFNRLGAREILSEDSPYGRLQVFEKSKARALFYTGRFVGEVGRPDNLARGIYLALLQGEGHKDMLIIGDMARGLAGEALSAGAGSVDIEELDENVVRLERSIYAGFPVNYITGDIAGHSQEKRYDALVLGIIPDASFAAVRFFSDDYFRRYRSMLENGGVFVAFLPGNPDLISPPDLLASACVLKTAGEVFKNCVYIPGSPAIILCSDGNININPDYVLSTMDKRGIDSAYFRKGHIADILDPFRISVFRDKIDKAMDNVGVNSLSHSYLYFYMLLSDFYRHYGVYAQDVFNAMHRYAWLIAGLFIIFFYALLRVKRGVRISIVSFIHVSLYLAVLLAYQFHFGAIFLDMGLLSCTYMVAVGLGILYAREWYLKVFYFVLPLLALLCFFILGLNFKIAFFIFIFVSAFLQGMFIGASMSVLESRSVYWYDLAGAALSSILLGSLGIIVFGLVPVLWFLFVLALGLFFTAKG